MTWRLIQEVSPEFEWTRLDQPISGETALKIEQDWSYAGSFPGKAYVLLTQNFPDGSCYGFKKFYPYRHGRLFTTRIPDFLETAGWGTYSLSIKVNSWGRWQDDANWVVRIYEWIGETAPPTEPDPGPGENEPETPDITYDGGQEV
ncbi:hypothetical protein IQ260_00515 [Leptolyngbya cf. ectocarpi LEGE 11479]|uniref:Uncharacterized protein n=1 Tax=Leptolyngbya cf. ectocarpi LEGE 11479 TaxID=1828722 RepID=A0A928WZH0_LEPEC|nr:hypothetical protein [Leptolyngbya ectocarpi]MBE9065135.1 hypothetical protein [Leptolyngbya cf. ectocarpi LEGE 11479]